MASLCPTAQILAATLDALSEATLLVTGAGDVLHKNSSAGALFGTSGGDGGGDDARAGIDSLLTFTDKLWEDVVAGAALDDAGSSPVRRQVLLSAVLLGAGGAEPPGAVVKIVEVGRCPCCSDVTYFSATLRVQEQPAYIGNGDESRRLKRVQDTVDASFDAMFQIDEQGTICIANAAAVSLFGYSTQDDFMGNNISMICGGVHAERHDEYLRRYLATGVTKIMGKKREVPARRRDGSEFPVELGIREIKACDSDERIFCAFMKDLTEQKKHERELRLRENLTQAVVNSSFDPMFQIDEQGSICLVNKAACALFGWSESEFLGSNISMICGSEHGAKHSAYMARYLKSGEKRIIGRKRPTIARRKDRTEFEIELGVQEVTSETGEKYFCGYVRDTTRQKLESRRLRKHESLIKDEFFGTQSPNLQRVDSEGEKPKRPLRLRHAHTTGNM